MSAPAPGPPHRTGEARPLRGIPRSRAFWELKAEQMMNRIFDPEEPIDLAVEPQPEQPEARDPAGAAAVPAAAGPATAPAAVDPLAASAATRAPARRSAPEAALPRAGAARRARAGTRTAAGQPARRPDERLVLIGALCGVCMVSVAGSLLYFGYWNRLQQSLSQERNLLLVERLRSLGPANPSPVAGPEPATPALPAPTASMAAGAEGLPPPPPEEPWIQQLSTLPQTSPAPSRVLSVPVSPRLAAAAPAATGAAAAAASTPLPQLVGVVASGGRPASAIFLVGGNSTNVSGGEQIGSSGWRLRSADGETALIERGGEVRQVSIISGNGF